MTSLPARPGPLALSLALVLSTGAGCTTNDTHEMVGEIAVNVLTLQTGTTSELRDLRGTGPFTTYDVPPEEMLEVLTAAMRRAAGPDGPPYVEVYPSRRYGEVVAKEFAEPGQGYEDAFRSAAIAIVHALADRPGASRVEIHAVQRGPFHHGQVAWMKDLGR